MDFVKFFCSGAAPFYGTVLLPAAAGAVLFALRGRQKALSAWNIVFALLQLVPAAALFAGGGFSPFALPLSGQGLELRFAGDGLSRLFALGVALLFAPAAACCGAAWAHRPHGGQFLLYLYLSLALVNGALLSDNLDGMLFFWEALLIPLFLALLVGNREAPHTALKSLVSCAVANLTMMAGILITAVNAGTSTISGIASAPLSGNGRLGFALMFVGAAGQAGCMPFQSWMAGAAESQESFSGAYPALFYAPLGGYLCVRLATRVFSLPSGGTDSVLLMTLGAVTLVCCSAMALVQKTVKRSLAYLTAAQAGWMVLGAASGLPAGSAGAVFVSLNSAACLACLSFAADAALRRTGGKTGCGLARTMPGVSSCFALAGISLAGVPGFSGYFADEKILEAARAVNPVFFVCALVGMFFTGAALLKHGRALFGGSAAPASPAKAAAPVWPLAVLAAYGVLPGFFHVAAGKYVFGPALGAEDSARSGNAAAVVLLVCALALAALDHAYGCRKGGSPAAAGDHIRSLPVLRGVFAAAEKGYLDPYRWLTGLMGGFAWMCGNVEHGVSWFYDSFLVQGAKKTGDVLSRLDNGRLSRYVGMAFLGLACIAVILIVSLL